MSTPSRDLGPLATFLGGAMVLGGAGLGLVELLAVDRSVDVGRVSAALSLVFLGAPLLAWPSLRRAGIVDDPSTPWVRALTRLAAEHGQLVQTDPGTGAWFDLIHGGPRLTVLVEPGAARLTLRSRLAVRHGVTVVRRGEAPEGDAARWPEVLRGAAWSLRSEVRVASSTLEDARELHRALDRFYTFPGARAVTFGSGGFRVELELPAPEEVEAVVRRAMDAARAVAAAWAG